MRYSNIIVVSALAVGLANGEPTNGDDASSGGGLRGRDLSYYSWPSYYYGYGKARKLWKNGDYSCTSDGVDEFERDVRNDVLYGDCSDQYEHNYDNRSACRDGARDIVEDKEDECFASVSDCEGIGEAISGGIVAMHCELDRMSGSRGKRKKWSQDCKDIGIAECKDIVGKKSTYRNYDSSCTRPPKSLLKKLKGLCAKEVNQYLD